LNILKFLILTRGIFYVNLLKSDIIKSIRKIKTEDIVCRQPNAGEIKGCFSLLVRKVNGNIVVGSDEKHLDGIVCFFNYLISKAKGQDFPKEDCFEKSFKAYSTRNFLGKGYENLKLIIKEREKELFVLEKTEDQLIVVRKTEQLLIDLNNLERLFLEIVEGLKSNSIVDPEKGFIIYQEETEAIHSMSVAIVSNDINIYNLFF
jgi:hypothetical protein